MEMSRGTDCRGDRPEAAGPAGHGPSGPTLTPWQRADASGLVLAVRRRSTIEMERKRTDLAPWAVTVYNDLGGGAPNVFLQEHCYAEEIPAKLDQLITQALARGPRDAVAGDAMDLW